jgi:hypothetical protein
MGEKDDGIASYVSLDCTLDRGKLAREETKYKKMRQ